LEPQGTVLTRLGVRNFKVFDEVEIELGDRVVFVGPNNSGKTSALQALALWSAGVRRWVEKRGAGNVPKERAGVTINRRDLIAVPVPSANLLWRDLHVREGYRDEGKPKTRNVLIEIEVEGIDQGRSWRTTLEFDYANEESLYCRSRLGTNGSRVEVPAAAAAIRLAYLPPMSGLASNETRLDQGAIDVRIGEGRTAEVLRNLCWQVLSRGEGHWVRIVDRMRGLFGVDLDEPQYIKERGEIVMSFRTARGVNLDLSASGRGQQQTLLLLAHMAANPGSILLLDEPDAHLEILRQRQIYQVLTDSALESKSQIIAASHSEVILNEAADRDLVIAFVGKPHRIDDRKKQVSKALKEIGFEHYVQAEESGWVLYLEGSTDLAILRAFARKLDHPAKEALERPFVHYVANQPTQARHHFYGLREAKPDLLGVAVFDRLESLPPDPNLSQEMWRRREIENYLCHPSTLLAFAQAEGFRRAGELFAQPWRSAMAEAIDEIASALRALGKPEPGSSDLKASDDFLDPLFKRFYEKHGLPNLMRKSDYDALARCVASEDIDPEVREKLDRIAETAARARTVPGDIE
jgi:energy-coupling factor transporter ATP-binding protein EcfA2